VQAAEWGTSGLTMALIDTSSVLGVMEPAFESATAGLQGMLAQTSGEQVAVNSSG